MTASRLHAKRQKVFKSVFDTEVSQPTPYSTPSLRFTEKGQPFGGPLAHAPPSGPGFGALSDLQSSPNPQLPAAQVTDQARWDRAWHNITSRVQLPPSVAVEDSFGTLDSQDLDNEFHESLRVVLYPARHARHAAYTEDLLSWHTQQSRRHFIQNVLPLLSACEVSNGPIEVVQGSVHTLEAAHRQYFYGLQLIVRGMERDAGDQAIEKFRRDLHAVVSNSMSPALTEALRKVLDSLMRVLLDMEPPSKPSFLRKVTSREDDRKVQARQDVQGLVDGLQKVGLAGEKFQILFAEMLDAFMVEHIKSSFSGWGHGAGSEDKGTQGSMSMRRSMRGAGQSKRITALSDWVENSYARLAVEVFSRLEDAVIPWKDVERWKDIAIGRLAVLRIHELFDIVLHWPDSKDALDDLRMAVTTPQRRLQLTDAFSAAVQKRLLHPGRSTLDILKVYISMIRTFHALDHSKVLLDRVVHSLQLYLCQRDDAIRIVVNGLLGTSEDDKSDGASGKGQGRLVELAELLNDPSQQQQQHRSSQDDDGLDWDDMDWVPDPVDAGVNYKRPKSEDVIGTLINALGAQDIFIKEFQAVIAERLLSKQERFTQEVKVLHLLKKKFGEAALQNCDVMLRDIQDSRRVDSAISRSMDETREATPGGTMPPTVAYHTKILSRLFWPNLEKEHFLLPQPILEAQDRYAAGFEHLKSSRKLTWLNNHGTATVHLELEDRTVDKECKTYEATVIYAFHSEEGSSEPATRTVDELYMSLQLDDDMIRAALGFWASQRVLRETDTDTWVVIERLDAVDEGTADSGGAVADTAGSPTKPGKAAKGGPDAAEKERRQVYWQFIVGMLTNSAPAMPLMQMGMMMKMLIADGFAWSNEELQEFLGEKVANGELELAGGKYRLPKK
ncbi:Cullin family protein [Plectosphaerella cucumerina]|uniref:Anaphase-promoting complex subunit 2 n=1 Tax=Plectosphaerella cucumerina TaxID=40658 RepID=A0A8K0X8K7_9PEZI|nr:Cullin family protein [Plectosphaerella cucumerina]